MRIFGRILNIIVKKHTEEISKFQAHVKQGACHPQTKSIPSSEGDLRQYLEGKCSIATNSPCPTIYTTDDGSSYVLPSEVLKLYYCFKLTPHIIYCKDDIESTQGVANYWGTDASISLLEELEKTGVDAGKMLVVIWSDGFDINASNKGNRGSAKAISMSLLASLKQNDFRNSFILSLSRDDSDVHDIWWRRIIKHNLFSCNCLELTCCSSHAACY